MSTNTLKAFDPVGGPHEAGQMPAGRTANRGNAIRINTESPGIGPSPADCGLAIIHSGGERRLTRQAILRDHADIPPLRQGLPQRGKQTRSTILPSAPEKHDNGRQRFLVLGRLVKVQAHAPPLLLIHIRIDDQSLNM